MSIPWIAILALALLYIAHNVLPTLLAPFLTPLRRLPGPRSPSWFWGHLREYRDDPGTLPKAWIAKYGHVLRFKLMLNLDRLLTTDTKAVNHILTHSVDYQKPTHTRLSLASLFGEGLLIAESDVHRRQRRALNPAFGPAQIRGFMDLFFEKSMQLRDIWQSSIQQGDTNNMTQIDILEGLNQMTLDVIGLAGFGYRFDALTPSGKNNPLRSALNEILNPAAPASRLTLIQRFIPFFRWVPTQRKRKVLAARQSMLQIGAEILAQKKATLLTTSENGEKGGISSNGIDGSERDLLTLLIKANIANGLPESQRLSDDEVIAQIPTFFIAGHETTASAVTWCLFALSINVDIQDKLRKELRAVPTETPTMDELMALPYLDCVLRETLRLHPPVATSARQAMKDDIIPLNKPYVDTQGNVSDSIQIRAGDHIIIPIAAINQMKEIWGDDAEEFRPERWNSPPSAAAGIPGVWGNLLSFLGGPRACIGYRFSLIEFKALVFTLVRALEFELAIPKEQVTKKSLVVVKPVIIGRGEKGNQMPMFIRPARG